MLPTPPTGFAKATGVIEGRRLCKICNNSFPVTSDSDTKCPFCMATATVSVTKCKNSDNPD